MAKKLGRDAARRIVTERLRGFFTDFTAQVADGAAEIWARVERRVGQAPAEQPDTTSRPPPPPPPPIQRQPMQQQLSKQKEDKG